MEESLSKLKIESYIFLNNIYIFRVWHANQQTSGFSPYGNKTRVPYRRGRGT
jgi:hypothetical protein